MKCDNIKVLKESILLFQKRYEHRTDLRTDVTLTTIFQNGKVLMYEFSVKNMAFSDYWYIGPECIENIDDFWIMTHELRACETMTSISGDVMPIPAECSVCKIEKVMTS